MNQHASVSKSARNNDAFKEFSFPKSHRIRRHNEYRRMGRHCKRHNGKLIAIDVRENRSSVTRLGITVTKKFGDAHHRNRFKRMVREAFRLAYADLCRGIDLNIRPVGKNHDLSMQQIQEELLHFLQIAKA